MKFLESWDIMASNGYSSLDKQGRMDGVSLESLIAENADSGLVWTDPQTDPYICGHSGHFLSSCGHTFSHCIGLNVAGEKWEGDGMGPGIM